MKPPEKEPVTLLQYFTPTPLSLEFALASQLVRLETNSPEVLERTMLALGEREDSSVRHVHFVWRIVGEDDTADGDSGGADIADGALASSGAWPVPSSFGHEGLCFFNFGQRAFIAVDASAKCGLGFLPQRWVREGEGFTTVFLKVLLSLTSASLNSTLDVSHPPQANHACE